MDLYNNHVNLYQQDSKKPALLDTDGAALIIHEDADDYNQGKTGPRIVCGPIVAFPANHPVHRPT